MNAFYIANGVSKQSVHQSLKRQRQFDQELEVIVKEADQLKKEHPGCGVEKMYKTLQPKTMGRDKFCEIFLSLGYGVRRIKNHRRTTFASHINYPNLIEGLCVYRPHQLIQSDITYFDLKGKFYYLVFIIDVYTKLILGNQISNHMRAEANLQALEMALKKVKIKPGELIHHSDRGSQYGSDKYRKILENKGVQISMGMKATENAYAERINGTIKNEYLKRWIIRDEKELIEKTAQAVNHYNNKRKHRSFKMMFTPREFEQSWLTLEQAERPKEIIFTEGKPNLKKVFKHLEIYPAVDPMSHMCPLEY